MTLIISSTWDLAPRYGAGAPTLNAPGGGEPAPASVSITYPTDAALLIHGSPITILGTVNPPDTPVSVTGIGAATVVGSSWSRTFTPSVAGAATLEATAGSASDTTPVLVSDAIAPFLGLTTSAATVGNAYRNAVGFSNNITDLSLDDDGHWYEGQWKWDVNDVGMFQRRRIDQGGAGAWTNYVGQVRPHAVDNDEHHNGAFFTDGSGRKHFVFGVHDDPIRHAHVPKGSHAPISSVAQFNRAWQSGDPVVPWEVGATNEDSVTYPGFLKFTEIEGPSASAGDALFRYRRGSSGSGPWIIKYWDHDKGSEGTLTTLTTLIDDGVSSAYMDRWALCPVAHNGKRKVAVSWNWRTSSDASTTHDVCVVFLLITPATASTPAVLEAFKDNACTIPQALPITSANAQYVATIASDHGLHDNGHIGYSPDGSRLIISKIECFDPADVHTSANTPHNTQYRAYVNTSGTTWTRYTITSLRDTAGHYPNGSNITRGAPASVQRADGLVVFYVNMAETVASTTTYLGMTQIKTADFSNFDEDIVYVGDGPGLGVCTTSFNWELLLRTQNRYAALPVQTCALQPSPVLPVSSYVLCADIQVLSAPVQRIHQLGALPGGASHLFAYQANVPNSVIQTGGLVSRWGDVVRGGIRHANQVGSDSLKPTFTTGPGGVPLLAGNGSSKFLLVTGYDPPQPTGGVKLYVYGFFRKVGHVVGSAIVGSQSSSSFTVGYHSTAPDLTCRNGSVGAVISHTDTAGYYFFSGYFTGAASGTADRFRIGATAVDTFFSNSNPSALAIFGQSAGAGCSNIELISIGAATDRFVDENAFATAGKSLLEGMYQGLTINV